MKTIEEAAKEFSGRLNLTLSAKEHITRFDFECTFSAGVEFAQRWIPVEENSPNEGQRVLSAPCENPEDWEIELAFFIYGMFVSAHKDTKIRTSKYGEIESVHCEREKLNDTTHWRPIELK